MDASEKRTITSPGAGASTHLSLDGSSLPVPAPRLAGPPSEVDTRDSEKPVPPGPEVLVVSPARPFAEVARQPPSLKPVLRVMNTSNQLPYFSHTFSGTQLLAKHAPPLRLGDRPGSQTTIPETPPAPVPAFRRIPSPPLRQSSDPPSLLQPHNLSTRRATQNLSIDSPPAPAPRGVSTEHKTATGIPAYPNDPNQSPPSVRVGKPSTETPKDDEKLSPTKQKPPWIQTPSTTRSLGLPLDENAALSPSGSLEGPMLHWEPEELLKLRSWMTCICLVDFDLSIGQTMKFAYPSGSLNQAEGQNVASLAFPDSHSSAIGDRSFCFRFRTQQDGTAKMREKSPFLFGYVFFRQKRDATIHRGYFQKSVVLVSPLPYPKLFLNVVRIVGPLYFDYGASILEAACRNISQWPRPTEGGKLNLPVLGQIIKVQLEPGNTPPSCAPTLATESALKHQLTYPIEPVPTVKDHMRRNFTQMCAMGFGAALAVASLEATDNNLERAIDKARTELKIALKKGKKGIDLTDLYHPGGSGGVFQEVNIYGVFQKVLGNLWFLWELAVTGQPILVISKSPERCTQAVLGIMSMIAPLIYGGDFRPYFTIYDPDFKHYQELHDHNTLPCTILGVTNPFFLKAFPNFNNVLYLGAVNMGDKKGGDSKPGTPRKNLGPSKVQVRNVVSEHLQKPAVLKKKHRTDLVMNDDNINKIICRHNMHIEPDQRILERLISASSKSKSASVPAEAEKEISAINNAILRKHFRQLTENFLRPFEIYFGYDAKLLVHPEFNPYLNVVSLSEWDEDLFLDDVRRAPKGFFKNIPLRATSVAGSTRASLLKLYSKFFTSPHFYPWFHRKRELAKARIRTSVIAAIMRINLAQLIDGQTISNGAKMYRAIKKHLQHESKQKTQDPELFAVLVSHLEIVTNAIPTHTLEVLIGKREIDDLGDTKMGVRRATKNAGRPKQTSAKARRQEQKVQTGQLKRQPRRQKKQKNSRRKVPVNRPEEQPGHYVDASPA